MKISSNWIRKYVDIRADDRQLAADLTMAGIAIEGMVENTAEGGSIFEAEITTNRPDAMNHYGIAREAAAIYNAELRPIEPVLPRTDAKGKSKEEPFPIEIEDAEGCARYTTQVVRGVRIHASPEKVQKRFRALEQKPINNAADATNYVLLEMGHPTHAFDLDKLEGGKIIVRRARKGETLKTLDGVERKLEPEDLVIADAKKPVALAGVMGGFDSMITEATKNILIESAWFDPASVRKTSRRLGMHTDASHRFERGADWGATPVACARVAELISLSSKGELSGAQVDVVSRKVGGAQIPLRRAEVTRILGKELTAAEIARILGKLGFGVTAASLAPVAASGSGGTAAAIVESPADWQVTVPTWRLDVEREIDLVEEIARIHGYNNFPNTLPAFSGSLVELPEAAARARVRETLLALGYNEALSNTFIAREDSLRFASSAPVEIANPLSEEAASMRTTLVPGMLGMVAHNLNRGAADVRLFEAGHIYEMQGAAAEEKPSLVLGATGAAVGPSVHAAGRAYTFFDLKGDVETLLAEFQHNQIYFDATGLPEFLHPGRSARAVLDGVTVGHFGQLHPSVAAERKLKAEVFVAEIAVSRLFQRPLRTPRFEKLSRYPAVERDFSFSFEDAVTYARIEDTLRALKIAELRSLAAVDRLSSAQSAGKVPAGRYSMLLRAVFQSSERTLRDEDVAGWSEQIIAALKALGGVQRA